MKTKEEIKQLAFLEYPRLINDPYNPMEDDNTYERQIWIDAYTRCQEDNKDKKYTEEDLRNAIDETINACNIAQKESYGELEIDADKIISSLNKQFEVICPKCGGDSWKFNDVKTTIKYCKCGNDF
jgi:hypothetical protein